MFSLKEEKRNQKRNKLEVSVEKREEYEPRTFQDLESQCWYTLSLFPLSDERVGRKCVVFWQFLDISSP